MRWVLQSLWSFYNLLSAPRAAGRIGVGSVPMLVENSMHEKHERHLREQCDWSALVRYWMATQHPPAMEAAIEICRSQPRGNTDGWIALAQFLGEILQKPMFAVHEFPSVLPDLGSSEEQATIFLLGEWSKAALCETADRAPAHMREKFLESGLNSAHVCAGAARAIGDTATAAVFLALAARAAR